MRERVFLFDPADRFVLGTVGLPGERTFFIQIQQGNRLLSLSLEKSQAQALADRLSAMLRELRQNYPLLVIDRRTRDDAPLQTPIEEEFRIGLIGIVYDEAKEAIQIELQKLLDSSIDIQTEESSDDQDLARVWIHPSQAFHFVDRAKAVINAGRLPCPFCGGPIDSSGHLCPRANGYRR
ncbi:MAG: hypothetical protein RL381_817 [Actinomycetota bacterium]|jgi:uncharacterized repeat protein (TIGR03847 family)